MDIIRKYFSQKDVDFILSVHKEFGQKLFFEYSDKFIYSSSGTQNVEKRYVVGIKCDNTKQDKYFTFMNITPMKLDADDYYTVFMGYDVSNNFKKIYFENGYGLVGYEVDNNKINKRQYTRSHTIPDKVLQSMPEYMQNMVKSNIRVIFIRDEKNKLVYYFTLKNAIEYNEDFSCWIFAVAFDKNWKILHHTFYLRLKKIYEDNYIDPILLCYV